MTSYILLAGCHWENGRRYDFVKDRETVVESDFDDLDTRYVNKFLKVGGPRFTTDAPLDGEFLGHPSPIVRADTPAQREFEELTPENFNAPPKSVPEFGDDATEQFPGAAESGFRVGRRGGRYHVHKDGRPVGPIGGLVTKRQVESCMEKLSGETVSG